MIHIVKVIFVLVLVVLGIESFAQQSLSISSIDSIYAAMSIAERVEEVLVVSQRNKNPIFYTSIEIAKRRKRNHFQVWEYKDGIQDLLHSDVPFPTEEVMRMVKDDELLSLGNNLIVRLAAEKGFKGAVFPFGSAFCRGLASEFRVKSASRGIVPSQKPTDVVVLGGQSAFYLFEMPEMILRPNYSSTVQKKDLYTILLPETLKMVYGISLEPMQGVSVEEILINEGLIVTSNYLQDKNKLVRAFENNVLSNLLLEKVCKSVIKAKISSQFRGNSVTTEELMAYSDDLFGESIVLLKNMSEFIPLKYSASNQLGVLSLGGENIDPLYKILEKYTSIQKIVSSYKMTTELPILDFSNINLCNQLLVVINVAAYDLPSLKNVLLNVNRIAEDKSVVVALIGNHNGLKNVPTSNKFKGVIWSLSGNNFILESIGEILYGARDVKATLPYTINRDYRLGDGARVAKVRLDYGFPIQSGMDEKILSQIDNIALEAIKDKATPGCQVLVARGGSVVFEKAYGYHSYEKKKRVKESDVYDIASVTKITSSLPIIMRMIDDEKLNLSDSLGRFFSFADEHKKQIRIDEMLAHQAGFKAFVPFYINTIDTMLLHGDLFSRKYSSNYPIKLTDWMYLNKGVKYRDDLYSEIESRDFSLRVTPTMYLRKDYEDSIYYTLDTLSLRDKKDYLYSDIGYYYLKKIIEQSYNTTLDHVLDDFLLKPIGVTHMCYNAIDHLALDEIVPSEYDKVFRNSIIQGTVNDPGAAMLGGVGGHAGLFSNANDLAKIMQMYLNGGEYGGKRFLDEFTIDRFTARAFDNNRRGLGFDKPLLDKENGGPSCKYASDSSYGHSGFTGTMVWVDPEYDLLYIFLSNRTFPDQYNKKLIRTDVRTRIQEQIYKSIIGIDLN